MFASGEGEFERERAAIEGSRRGGRGGGGGEDGEGRSAEDNVMQKLLDKDYAGKREFGLPAYQRPINARADDLTDSVHAVQSISTRSCSRCKR